MVGASNAPSPLQKTHAVLFVGCGNVEFAVIVEIGKQNGVRLIADSGEVHDARERAVAIAGIDCGIAAFIENQHDIRLAVAVDIADGDIHRLGEGSGDSARCLKRPVAIAQ